MKKKVNLPVPTSFLQKTFDMLNEETLSKIISWNPDGTEFIIYNVNEFSEKVLPLYFKHSNFASFIRQLNMYDFHKLRSKGQEHIYKHPLFIKDKPEFLKNIHRKTSESAWPLVSRNNYEKPEMAPVIKKLVQLHQTNTNYQCQIASLEEKVENLATQNKILADQVWENQDRMKSIENALIFFANYMKGNNPEEMCRHFPILENILSITDVPQSSATTKKMKFEEPEIHLGSPLDYSGFEEDLLLSPKEKIDVPDYDYGISHTTPYDTPEDSVDVDKLDFLLDQ